MLQNTQTLSLHAAHYKLHIQANGIQATGLGWLPHYRQIQPKADDGAYLTNYKFVPIKKRGRSLSINRHSKQTTMSTKTLHTNTGESTALLEASLMIDSYSEDQAELLLTQIRSLKEEYRIILQEQVGDIINALEQDYTEAKPGKAWIDLDLHMYFTEESYEEEMISKRLSNAREIYNLILIA